MKSSKQKALEAKGWKVGTVSDFLGLSKEESNFIEVKLLLSKSLEKRRKTKKLTQEKLAELIKSSQSRVAKMEKGDPTVSLDLLFKSHFALGTTKNQIAKILGDIH
jgi:DNA-binding XRE family transcriptional regulator